MAVSAEHVHGEHRCLLVIGALAGLAEHRDLFSADARLFLFTGLSGGFTTFSAFGYEGVCLFRRGDFAVAATYAVLSVLVGFAAVWMRGAGSGQGSRVPFVIGFALLLTLASSRSRS